MSRPVGPILPTDAGQFMVRSAVARSDQACDDHREDRAVPPDASHRVPDGADPRRSGHRAGRARPVGRVLQHRAAALGAGHGHAASRFSAPRLVGRQRSRRCSVNVQVMTGSRARSPPPGSSRSRGRRSAAASTEPADGWASTCRARRSGPGTARSSIKTVLRTNQKEVRKGHAAEASRTRHDDRRGGTDQAEPFRHVP